MLPLSMTSRVYVGLNSSKASSSKEAGSLTLLFLMGVSFFLRVLIIPSYPSCWDHFDSICVFVLIAKE